jgi:hypothetical protein
MISFETIVQLLNPLDQKAVLNLRDPPDNEKESRLKSIMYEATLFKSKYTIDLIDHYLCAATVFALRMIGQDNSNLNQFYDFTYYFEFALLEFGLRLWKMFFSNLYSVYERTEITFRTTYFHGELWNSIERNLNENAYIYLYFAFINYKEICMNKLEYGENDEKSLFSRIRYMNNRSFLIGEFARKYEIKFKHTVSAIVHYVKHSHERIIGQKRSPFNLIRTPPVQFQREANYPCIDKNNYVKCSDSYEISVNEGKFQGSGPAYSAHVKKTVLSKSNPFHLVSYSRKFIRTHITNES